MASGTDAPVDLYIAAYAAAAGDTKFAGLPSRLRGLVDAGESVRRTDAPTCLSAGRHRH